MKFIALFIVLLSPVYGNPLGTPIQDAINVPYIVSITDLMMYTQHTASGSILNSRYIVTNASPFTTWSVPSHFMAVANIPRTWDRSDDIYAIESIVVHENYDQDTLENDIAILRTTTPISFHERVQPISLSQQYLSNQNVVFSGFGFVEENPITHVPLTTVGFRTISNDECRSILGDQGAFRVVDSKACVVSQDNRVICNYDNGAPLTIGNELMGISSWSVSCRSGYPILVERITSHLAFIQRNIN